jgi:DNA-binding NarL/FixJ family response regulator
MKAANQTEAVGTDRKVTILYLARELDLSLLLGADGSEERPRVCAALDPTDAVREITNNAIDCVVTENRWYSNHEGVPFVTAVKRAAPRVPVVVYAGDGPVTDEEKLLEAGADAFYWQTTNPAEQTRIREEILTLAAQADTHQPNSAQNDELEQLLKLSDAAFAVHDLANDRNIAYSGLENMAPPSQSTLTITDAFEMIYEGDRESVLEKNEAVFAKDPQAFDSLSEEFGTFSERVRVRKSDQSIAHCLMRGAAVFDGDRLVKMYNVLTDVASEEMLNWKLRSERTLFGTESDHRVAEEVCEELVDQADCAAAWITQSENAEPRLLLAAAGEHERFVTETQSVACVESLTDRVIATGNAWRKAVKKGTGKLGSRERFRASTRRVRTPQRFQSQ